MGVQVVFDYPGWVAQYPEFASVDAPTATRWFNVATIYHRNDGTGPVRSVSTQQILLGMITAHLVSRFVPIDGQAPSNLVGRVSDASIGPVSAAVEGFTGVPGSQQWFLQTKYGSDYWAATAPYRQMRYLRPHPRNFGPVFPGFPTSG